MYNFKIEKIVTNNNTEIIPKGINVIIGPNNSGKSQFLKDIKNTLGSQYNFDKKNVIINYMEYNLPKSKEEFIERYNLDSKIFRNNENQYYIRNYSGITNNDIVISNSVSNYLDTGNINIHSEWEKDLQRQISNFEDIICNDDAIIDYENFPENSVVHNETYVEYEKNGEIIKQTIGSGGFPLYSQKGESINSFINTYGNLFFNYLGTEEKLLMCKRQKKYGLQDHNTNFLSEVQFNFELLSKLSEYTKIMFKRDIYLDRFSWGESILFRVGDNFDFIRNASRDNSEVEIKLKDYSILDYEGDGIKSFITNYIALHMNDKNILLLDEPESFLHPPLAKQLGEIIAESASENKQIFISTHSVDLLKGILNVNKDINVIRITRNNNINEFNLLDRKRIEQIISNPMLSSSNVLNGLFCEKVYICEAESDEEIFQSLHDKVNSYDSAFFTHGKNKQTLKDIANAYNELNIPNYRIYDFDILRDEDFNRALNIFIEYKEKDEYIKIRKELNSVLEKYHYYNGGISQIKDKKLKIKVTNMLINLKKSKIIILKYGCLENSFCDLGINYTTKKGNWFKEAIKLINESNNEKLKTSYIYNWIFEEEI